MTNNFKINSDTADILGVYTVLYFPYGVQVTDSSNNIVNLDARLLGLVDRYLEGEFRGGSDWIY